MDVADPEYPRHASLVWQAQYVVAPTVYGWDIIRFVRTDSGYTLSMFVELEDWSVNSSLLLFKPTLVAYEWNGSSTVEAS